MLVKVDDLRREMRQLAVRRGTPDSSADLVVDHFLDAELRGKWTHGVAKLCFESQFFNDRSGSPTITNDYGSIALVDANREIGPVSASYCVTLACLKAKKYGIGLVGMKNSQRYGTLGYWAEAITREGLYGLVFNTTVPEATVDGGTGPVFGVNPIGFGAPAEGGPIIGDLATTSATMGSVWEARRGSGILLPDAFLDAAGEHTEDPFDVHAAIIFGGHKGLAVSTLVQLFAGPLLGFPAGAAIETPYDAGYFFLAVRPVGVPDDQTHLAASAAFRAAVERSEHRDGGHLRLCGSQSAQHRHAQLLVGTVDVRDEIYQRLGQCLSEPVT
jgi:LDH2 family malate/lactate/ureidoglycolate dehydrogenase